MSVVESLPAGSAGALLIGARERPLGTILVESNRICWAAAAGMSRRLRDILRNLCGVAISERNLDAIYARCRLERQPLGEALVASGLVSPERMREAIKQHTIESLLALDAALTSSVWRDTPSWPMSWVEHAGHGYNPRYTFGAAEILASAGGLSLDETSIEIITDHLQTLESASCAKVAFLPELDGSVRFVATATVLDVRIPELTALVSWADAALAASPGFSPEAAHACARMADGGAVAWRYEGKSCAAICTDATSLQRLIASLGNRSLSVVMATRIAVLDRVRERLMTTKQGD